MVVKLKTMFNSLSDGIKQELIFLVKLSLWSFIYAPSRENKESLGSKCYF